MSGKDIYPREKQAGLTRRQFLRLAGGALGAAALLPLANWTSVYAEEAPVPAYAAPASLGRIASWGVEIRQKPTLEGKLVRTA
jgi:hypothetical protein